MEFGLEAAYARWDAAVKEASGAWTVDGSNVWGIPPAPAEAHEFRRHFALWLDTELAIPAEDVAAMYTEDLGPEGPVREVVAVAFEEALTDIEALLAAGDEAAQGSDGSAIVASIQARTVADASAAEVALLEAELALLARRIDEDGRWIELPVRSVGILEAGGAMELVGDELGRLPLGLAGHTALLLAPGDGLGAKTAEAEQNAAAATAARDAYITTMRAQVERRVRLGTGSLP